MRSMRRFGERFSGNSMYDVLDYELLRVFRVVRGSFSKLFMAINFYLYKECYVNNYTYIIEFTMN